MFNDKGTESGWIHISIDILCVFIDIAWLVFLIWETTEDREKYRPLRFLYCKYDPRDDDEKDKGDKKYTKLKLKKYFWYLILIIFLLYCFKFTKTIYNQSVFLYNTSKKYHNTYQQKIEEKQGFYDKLWKIYLQKEKITNVNKETFLAVTKLIMENRKDGMNVSWKWLQENQQIPYEEFTAFYKDLSSFIAQQREGYFNIEKTCQIISNQNNTLLDTFPNNLYNRVLKLQKIKFEYGFLSDSTNNVFNTHKENLK